jgi:hypothetical protein
MFRRGPALEPAMIEKGDFFREQIKHCRSQAEGAANKADREFWLRLAQPSQLAINSEVYGASAGSVREVLAGLDPRLVCLQAGWRKVGTTRGENQGSRCHG